MVVSQNHENILERDEKSCRGIKNDRPEKYGTCFEYQEKETGLLWTCKKASFPTKISVGESGGRKKRQRTKKKELNWQRERDDENEYGIVQCEGT